MKIILTAITKTLSDKVFFEEKFSDQSMTKIMSDRILGPKKKFLEK